ncbi:MAG: hypothetical protein LBS52_01985 [Dysgonamonadaceae bacterium]|nr:hypothetical protein [Dysgonamonadaceae bacterium]
MQAFSRQTRNYTETVNGVSFDHSSPYEFVVSVRDFGSPDYRSDSLGFRIALSQAE